MESETEIRFMYVNMYMYIYSYAYAHTYICVVCIGVYVRRVRDGGQGLAGIFLLCPYGRAGRTSSVPGSMVTGS